MTGRQENSINSGVDADLKGATADEAVATFAGSSEPELSSAFMKVNHATLAPTGNGILSTKTFAVKDVFALEGTHTGFGHPDWLRTSRQETKTAPIVEKLLSAGSRLIGRTVSDELCYSLTGANFHYGSPPNPAAMDRLSGGSSSGSASAVAAKECDFAMGTDCGGSVRVPASYCGIYGIRTSFDSIDLTGIPKFSSTFDTVGWFARDAGLLADVGEVLLRKTEHARLSRLTLLSDTFDYVDDEYRPIFDAALNALRASLEDVSSQPVTETLSVWRQVFQTIQGHEIWENLGGWISSESPDLSPGVAERFRAASEIVPGVARKACEDRVEICKKIAGFFEPNGVLCLPTVPHAAPLRASSIDSLETNKRNNAMSLLSIAGLAGLPQISVPLETGDLPPIGLSFVGPAGSDLELLDFVKRVDPVLRSKG